MEVYRKFRIGPLRIYITTYRLKRRGASDKLYRNNRATILRMKHRLWKAIGGRCQQCGRHFDEQQLEVHHIAPVSERPDLIRCKSNMLLLCHECHVNLHRHSAN